MNENSRSTAALFVIDGAEPAPDVARAAEALFANELTWAVLTVVAEHPRLTTGETGFAGPVLTPGEMDELAAADRVAGDAVAAATSRAIGDQPITQVVDRGDVVEAVQRFRSEHPADVIVAASPEVAERLANAGVVPVLVMPSGGPSSVGGPVLVAVDGSSLDEQVMAETTRLFDTGTTDFAVVHVARGHSPARSDVTDRRIVDDASADLAGRIGDTPDGVTISIGEVGDPVTGIMAAADEHDASLIVLGTHGRGWLSRLFQHSVSGAVLEQASRPVIVMASSSGRDDTVRT
jgi:nucleotide-binding universal stress UspA family protein